jgi:hypothetical protein
MERVMLNKLCIASTCEREPVLRCVAGRYRKLVYVLNPKAMKIRQSRYLGEVGFPQAHVFVFDKSLFDGLSSAYRSGDSQLLGSLWGRAKRYGLTD